MPSVSFELNAFLLKIVRPIGRKSEVSTMNDLDALTTALS